MRCKSCNVIMKDFDFMLDDELCSYCFSVVNQTIQELEEEDDHEKE